MWCYKMLVSFRGGAPFNMTAQPVFTLRCQME